MTATENTDSKVARVMNAYGIEGKVDELELAWTGDGRPKRSLRELADDFNKAVLEKAMLDAGLNPIDGEVENLYRLLDGDVSGGKRAEAEAKLKRAGIDPDELRTDFVSHQSIHTYLTDYREIEPPTEDPVNRSESATETVQRMKGRYESVVDGTLENLAESGDLNLGDVDVLITSQVFCEDCERQFEVVDLIDRGGCDCE